MNTSNQNHDPTTTDDLPDRLVDLALCELVGGNSPPDLSSRIAAATFRQPAAVGQVPRTRQDRAFWVNLAVAVMLLIGVTIVLFPQVRSARQLARVGAEQDRLGNHHDPSRPFPTASTTPMGDNANAAIHSEMSDVQITDNKESSVRERLSAVKKSKAEPTAAKPVDFDSLGDLAQSTVTTESFSLSGGTSPSATPNSSLGTFPSQNPPQPQTWGISRQGGPEGGPGGSRRKDRYGSMDLVAKSELQPAGDTFGLARSGPNRVPNESSPQTSRADALYAHDDDIAAKAVAPRAGFAFGNRYEKGINAVPETSVVAGVTSNSTAAVDQTKRVMIGYEWKETANAGNIGNELGVPFLGAGTTDGSGPNHAGDRYTQIVENPFIKAEGGAAVSTLSIDVDTASYANVRQFLLQMNQLPPPDAVRIEELVNYFQYDYEAPKQSDEAPFAAHVEVTACPWAPEHRLARIGIKGREMDRNKRPQSNLVFLVDVSGSMNEPAKLPLVVYGLEQLTRELGENDHIAIVVYAGTEGLVLPSTSGSKQDTILAALAKLQAGGSTAGGAGIQLAYQIAEDNFIKGGTNRVILCTDGDFNVGVTNTADLQRLVEKKAKDTGVFLSTLGFGRGNLNDAMMVAISDHGNGNYHYIDNRTEARRVLVEEMTGTLVTIAKDVKIQVEFNPAQVAGYRLIGYEKRALRTEDFNDDKKDAGEIGAGHTVTALYEIVPAGKKTEIAPVDDLKYQKRKVLLTDGDSTDSRPQAPAESSRELLTLKMRYKAPDGDTSKKLEWPVTDDGKAFSSASGDLKFAASVAGFGLMLRNSQYKGNLTYAATLELAQSGIGEDTHGYRKEFLDMVRKAKELRHE